MDFTLTADHDAIRETARAFCQRELVPHLRDWDRAAQLPREVIQKMGAAGLLGVCIPRRYGGLGFDYLSLGIVSEELERADSAFRVLIAVHLGLNSLALFQWGNEAQKEQYLVPQARGEKLGAFGLTEPGAGSDVANIRTTARHDGKRLHPQRREDVDWLRGISRTISLFSLTQIVQRNTVGSLRSLLNEIMMVSPLPVWSTS